MGNGAKPGRSSQAGRVLPKYEVNKPAELDVRSVIELSRGFILTLRLLPALLLLQAHLFVCVRALPDVLATETRFAHPDTGAWPRGVYLMGKLLPDASWGGRGKEGLGAKPWHVQLWWEGCCALRV